MDTWAQEMAAASNTAATATARPPESPEQAALGNAIGQLQPNDSATLSMTAGGQWSIASLGAQAQAQDGASITVTNVGTASSPRYQVTLTETQQAGLSAKSAGGDDPKPSASDKPSARTQTKGVIDEPGCGTDQPSSKPTPIFGVAPGPVYPVPEGGVGVVARIPIFGQTKPSQRGGGSGDSECQTQATTSGQDQSQSSLSAQSNESMTYTVTVTVGPKDVARATNTFAAMVPATASKSGNFFDNPIMDEISGKSGRAAGVSPSELGLLKDNLTSYGETLTGQGSAVAQFANNNLGQLQFSVNNQNQVSLGRSVTLPSGGQPANVAYTLSQQISTAPTIDLPRGSGSDLGSEQWQFSYTQQYNLNLTKKEIENTPGIFLGQGERWGRPDAVQETWQTQQQLAPTVNLPFGSIAGDGLVQTMTITETHTSQRPTPSWQTTINTTDNSSTTVVVG